MEKDKAYIDKEVIDFTGERFIPGIEDDELAIEHIQRYYSILHVVKGKTVLDIACGDGYGTEILSKEAEKVIGIDIDSVTIQKAKEKYKNENLDYIVGNVINIPLSNHSIDIVISFETIEHVEEKQQKLFLDEIKRVLKKDGILVISTPNKTIYSDRYQYHNKWHKKEFYKKEFEEFLQKEFKYLEFYCQYDEVVNVIENREISNESIFYRGREREGKYYIVIASNQSKLPLLRPILRMRSNEEYERCISRIRYLQEEEEERNEHIRKLDREIKEKGKRIVELQEGEKSRNEHIKDLDIELKEKNQYIQENRNQIEILEIKLQYEEKNRIQVQKFLEFDQKREEWYCSLQEKIEEFKNQRIEELNGEKEERDYLIDNLMQEIKEKNIQFQNLEDNMIKQKEKEIFIIVENYKERIEELKKEKERYEEIIKKIQEEKEFYKEKTKDRERFLVVCKKKIEELEEVKDKEERNRREMQVILNSYTEKIGELEKIKEEQERRIEKIISSYKQEIEKIDKEKEKEIQENIILYEEKIRSLGDIDKKNQIAIKTIEEKNNQLQEIRKSYDRLKQTFDETYATVEEYQEKIKELELEQTNLYCSLEQQDRLKQNMEQHIRNKEGHIELLLESDRELERIKHSRSWKLMTVIWKINSKLFPVGSKRRLSGKLLLRVVQHPVQSMKIITTPRKLKNFFYYLKKDGVTFVSRRVDESFLGIKVEPAVLVVEQIREEGKDISQYEPFSFIRQENPIVSIIIPVYNQFEYTYNCLKSILNNSKELSYEVIIADDCSTDLTVHLTELVENVTVIKNHENLRFLKNCNHAAKFVRGKYIFFLNNDTQVQQNWLQPLLYLLEKDASIGMTGSKLVYSDGRLQEAGGILWQDGSAWNYGNQSNAEDSEYNYVKEVDYISGAAIMIRKTLWEKIGGFDEYFSPAYCEDSDLAFEVRKHGYKVVYQPLSVVVHFEGISNGVDIENGQKSYQVVNQKKFFDKWNDVLKKENFPNAEKVFLARDRSRDKPILLMIDHYVPQYDKDAGSRTVLQYLKMFVHMGYHVKFIGDNFYRHEPYTTVLQQMGIEVLYGPYYANNWKKWIKDNGEYIQFVFLNRPHISVKYIDYIKSQTKAKVIYYGHDLHFLREMRKYELTKDRKALEDSKDWKEKELKLMHQADVVYYPSDIEVKEIMKIDSSINVKAIIAYIFSNIVWEKYQYEKRKDIMFVGGFTHTPNVDAVLWFVQNIFPIVMKRIPDIKFIVMGSNPPEEIKNLENENVIIKGFVTDEELEQYYKSCRLSVVPLRYGAGIKGKVVEAMRYGIPVVTTSIGAEGIIGAEKILCIADSERTLGEKLAALYKNSKKLSKMSSASYEYIKYHFSEENAWKLIEEDFRF